jgi:hypothetical protein
MDPDAGRPAAAAERLQVVHFDPRVDGIACCLQRRQEHRGLGSQTHVLEDVGAEFQM